MASDYLLEEEPNLGLFFLDSVFNGLSLGYCADISMTYWVGVAYGIVDWLSIPDFSVRLTLLLNILIANSGSSSEGGLAF